MTTTRLENKVDGYYENVLNEAPKRQPRKFLNPNFITSNSLFVQEYEGLEQRLASPYDKSNQETPDRCDFPYPAWFRPDFEGMQGWWFV